MTFADGICDKCGSDKVIAEVNGQPLCESCFQESFRSVRRFSDMLIDAFVTKGGSASPKEGRDGRE